MFVLSLNANLSARISEILPSFVVTEGHLYGYCFKHAFLCTSVSYVGNNRIRHRLIRIPTSLGFYDQEIGIRFQAEDRDLHLVHSMQTGYGTQSSSYPVVNGSTSQPLNWSGRGEGYLLRSRVEIKNTWSSGFTLPYVFMTWCLNKSKEEFCILFRKEENRIPPGILLILRFISHCSTYRTRGINAVYTPPLPVVPPKFPTDATRKTSVVNCCTVSSY